MPTQSLEAPGFSDGRPPVDQRILGLDRRTFGLPLIAAAVAVLWLVVMPQINNAIHYDDPVTAGDALIVGAGTSMSPPVGWSIQSGIRAGGGSRAPGAGSAVTSVAGDGVTVTTQAGPFAGDAKALVNQVFDVDKKIAADKGFTAAKGGPSTVTLDGHNGVVRQYKSLTGEGAVLGFVKAGKALEIVISGDPGSLQRNSGKLGRMLASVNFNAQGF